MSRNKKDAQQIPAHLRPMFNHSHKPRSRREFLGQGFISGAGMVLTPSLLTMISRHAQGAPDCGAAGSTAQQIPFMIFDFAGGCNFAMGNVLVGKAGGQTDFLDDAAVATLSIPSTQNPLNNPAMVDNELGLLFHKNSAWLAGFRSATTATTRAKMNGVIVCGRSADDTANNPLNPAFWVQKAGLKGALVDIIGSGSGNALGRSQAPADSVTTASPILVRSSADSLSIVNTGLIGQLLPDPGQAEKLLKATHSMSAGQLAAFMEKDVPTQVKTLVECGYIKATDNLTKFTATAVNPANDALVTAVKGVNNIATDALIPDQFTVTTANDDKVTTVAKLLLDGYAGVGTVEFGGYDYHGNDAIQTAQKDFDAGRSAGMAFELAARKGKPLMAAFITDGSVSASSTTPVADPRVAGKFDFASDSGVRSSAFVLGFNPIAKPEMAGSTQIGAFLDGAGSVNQDISSVGNNVSNVSKALALQWLAANGREGEFDKLFGNTLGTNLTPFLAFAKFKTA